LGLVAQLLYGWIDCIALGQKPSIFWWVYLALSTILFKNVYENSQSNPQDTCDTITANNFS
jgi:hypothetical protein